MLGVKLYFNSSSIKPGKSSIERATCNGLDNKQAIYVTLNYELVNTVYVHLLTLSKLHQSTAVTVLPVLKSPGCRRYC
jgi:hypothetical protein